MLYQFLWSEPKQHTEFVMTLNDASRYVFISDMLVAYFWRLCKREIKDGYDVPELKRVWITKSGNMWAEIACRLGDYTYKVYWNKTQERWKKADA